MDLLIDVAFILAAVLAATLGAAVVRRRFSIDDLRRHRDVVGVVFQVVGTLYAVLLAFAVYVVWNHFDVATRAVEREASTLSDVEHVVAQLPSELRAQVQAKLIAYASTVVDEEWEIMAQGGLSVKASTIIEDAWKLCLSWEPRSNRESVLYEKCVARFLDLRGDRIERFLGERISVPGLVWVVLLAVAAVLVMLSWFLIVDDAAHHTLLVAVLTVVVALMCTLIAELDHPYSGFVRVSSAPIRMIRHL